MNVAMQFLWHHPEINLLEFVMKLYLNKEVLNENISNNNKK